MSDSSRRGFLKVAGTGAAVAGVAVVSSRAVTSDAATPEASAPAALPRSAKGAMVVHVQDVRTGEMSLMVEGHEITLTDRDLAARIASALHNNSPRTVNNPSV